MLTNVVEKTLQRKDGSGPFQVYEIETSAGTYRSRKDLATKLRSLIGAQIEMVTRVEQKGDWTNYYIDYADIASNQPDPVGQAQAATSNPVVQAQIAQETGPLAAEERKNKSIHRQTAAKVAAMIADGNPQTFWSNVADLFTYFQTGTVPGTPTDEGFDDIPFD